MREWQEVQEVPRTQRLGKTDQTSGVHALDTETVPTVKGERSPRGRIRGPSQEERARERLIEYGPRALATRELLAILVGSAARGRSATDVADHLLERSGGSLRSLACLGGPSLRRVPGVGAATAARVEAAFELGRRCGDEALRTEGVLAGPRDVFARMETRLRDLTQEEFHALLLSARHRLVRTALVTRGILDASLVHPREVFRPAIAESAAAVILVHNHPSGDPEPSAQDLAVTRQLVEAGRAVGIPVLDHVIVGDGRFVSLAERGLMSPP